MNSIEKQLHDLGDEIDELIYHMSGSGSESYLKQLYVTKVQRYNKLKEQLQKQIDTIDNYKRAMHGI